MEELIVKISNGKTPFIGVLQDSYNPKWCTIEWFEKKSGPCQLLLDPSHELVMYLAYEKYQARHSMKYDPVKLLKFIGLTKNCKAYNFGYVQWNGHKHEIMKTERGISMVLKVDSIEVIDALLSLTPG